LTEELVNKPGLQVQAMRRRSQFTVEELSAPFRARIQMLMRDMKSAAPE
jgi:hypothetical protein